MKKLVAIFVCLMSVLTTYGQFGAFNKNQNGNVQVLKRVVRTQKLEGFSKKITINGSKSFWVSDDYACLDYRIIAQKDYFSEKKMSIMTGELIEKKMPAYGLINGDNNIVVPCVYADITIDTNRGCIVLHQCNKKHSDSKYGLVDFDGNEVLPTKFSEKNIWNNYNKLSSDVKSKCIELYNSKSALYAAKGGTTASDKQNAVMAANSKTKTKPQIPKSDVDVNIPVTNKKTTNTFVLIIANEEYSFVDNVDFALNDGRTFKEYCVKTLGIPERQILYYENATGGIISGGIEKMVQAMSIFDGARAIVYYCGHGIPDEHTGDAYIIPTDGKGTNTGSCYSLSELYSKLSKSGAANVTYFMDACFSGANKNGSMLVAARGVAREAKKETLTGNAIVFSAASGEETAMTYKEKGHGLFTYFLLKKLQESKGDVNYNELANYIQTNVKKESFLTNEKLQTPAVLVSNDAIGSWQELTLK